MQLFPISIFDFFDLFVCNPPRPVSGSSRQPRTPGRPTTSATPVSLAIPWQGVLAVHSRPGLAQWCQISALHGARGTSGSGTFAASCRHRAPAGSTSRPQGTSINATPPVPRCPQLCVGLDVAGYPSLPILSQYTKNSKTAGAVSYEFVPGSIAGLWNARCFLRGRRPPHVTNTIRLDSTARKGVLFFFRPRNNQYPLSFTCTALESCLLPLVRSLAGPGRV